MVRQAYGKQRGTHENRYLFIKCYKHDNMRDHDGCRHLLYGSAADLGHQDRGLWFIENLTERFREPVQYDEYYPPATWPG